MRLAAPAAWGEACPLPPRRFNGAAWQPPDTLSGTTTFAPALANDTGTGALIVAWTTATGKIDCLNCCIAPVYTLPHALTSAAPAVAAMNLYRYGTLYFGWRDKATGKIGYAASFNTSTGYGYHAFTPQQFVPQALTSTTPALAISGTTLWPAWIGRRFVAGSAEGAGSAGTAWDRTGPAPL